MNVPATCGEFSSGHQTHSCIGPIALFIGLQLTNVMLRNDLTPYRQKHCSRAGFILKHMKLCPCLIWGQTECPKFAINEELQAVRRSKHSQSKYFFIFQGIKCLAAGAARQSFHFHSTHEICAFNLFTVFLATLTAICIFMIVIE